MDFNLACFHKSKQSTLPEELRTTPNNLLTEIPIVSNRFDLPQKVRLLFKGLFSILYRTQSF